MSEARYTVFGANIILHSGDQLLLQRKTPGYRFLAYVGQLCLIGGGWTEDSDLSPRQTALRELAEEVEPAALYADAEAALRFVGTYEIVVPAEVSGRQPLDRQPARLLTFAFELPVPTLEGAWLLEGDAAPIDTIAELAEPVCWGHDHILADWAARSGRPAPRLRCEPRVTCARVGDVEPKDYGELELERLQINPRRR